VNEKDPYLTGSMLIAMPGIGDSRFDRSLIYVCAHTPEGAMGLIVNKLADNLTFPDLLEQLEIDKTPAGEDIRVHVGGPVEAGRGFVLHSSDYLRESSMQVDQGVALTATLDILRDIATGTGPDRSLLALGYAGWSAGQLDDEIQANGWLTVEADEDLIFGSHLEDKWEKAMHKIGLDLSKLSSHSGHA
jgi:putative transcriptional regulator